MPLFLIVIAAIPTFLLWHSLLFIARKATAKNKISSKGSNSDLIFLLVFFGVITEIAIISWLGEIVGIIFLIFSAIIGALVIMAFNAAIREREQYQTVSSLTEKYAKELAIRKKQLTIPGSYGVLDETSWLNEIESFISRVVHPVTGNIGFSSQNYRKIRSLIDAVASNNIAKTEFSNALSPLEYEAYVANSLKDSGWETRLTKASGDQGVDVLASKNGIRVVIQCKLYGSSVGNAAVQEIIAGREFEKADYAVVISNASYTKSARQLAATANVLLLHHDELMDLESRLP